MLRFRCLALGICLRGHWLACLLAFTMQAASILQDLITREQLGAIIGTVTLYSAREAAPRASLREQVGRAGRAIARMVMR